MTGITGYHRLYLANNCEDFSNSAKPSGVSETSGASNTSGASGASDVSGASGSIKPDNKDEDTDIYNPETETFDNNGGEGWYGFDDSGTFSFGGAGTKPGGSNTFTISTGAITVGNSSGFGFTFTWHL